MTCVHSGKPINQCTCGYCVALSDEFNTIQIEADDIYYELYRLHDNIMLDDTAPYLLCYQHNQQN